MCIYTFIEGFICMDFTQEFLDKWVGHVKFSCCSGPAGSRSFCPLDVF